MVRMHKKVRPGLKLDLVQVDFSFIKRDNFLCIILRYLVLFLNIVFESLKFATYFLKKLKVKVYLCLN